MLDVLELGASLLELAQVLGGHLLRLVGLSLVAVEANGQPVDNRALLLLVDLVHLELTHDLFVFAQVLQVLLCYFVVFQFFVVERLLQLGNLKIKIFFFNFFMIFT